MRVAFSCVPIAATFSHAIATFAFGSRASAGLMLVAIGALLASAPARAQTYDPDYPICMRIYGRVSYFDCRYASLEQCKFSAAGRSASCVANPYFAQKKQAAPRRSRRAD
jgi:uncharacterized protein DUF3551